MFHKLITQVSTSQDAFVTVEICATSKKTSTVGEEMWIVHHRSLKVNKLLSFTRKKLRYYLKIKC